MRPFLLTFAILGLAIALFSVPTTQTEARAVAYGMLDRIDSGHTHALQTAIPLSDDDGIVVYLFPLSPAGYIAVSADDALTPVPAYSLTGSCDRTDDPDHTLATLLTRDMRLRLQALPQTPESTQLANREAREGLIAGSLRDRPQQWPPEGTTPSEGWVVSEWGQGNPWNSFCPIDLDSGQRGVAGCPAVAMGQILNYFETDNHTRFNDDDDYHHNYDGQSYQIDDDSATYGFPAFPELNGMLDTLDAHWLNQIPLTSDDMGALVFACGVAATQVWSPSGSGTFAVSQAFEAYRRFGFQSAALLTEASEDLYPRIIANIQDALPVHLAVVTPAWDAGHNVVIDGYNTDGYYHLNFGWNGSYDGWYQLPEGFPFNLTVVEGAVVDLMPYEYVSVWPESVEFLTVQQTLTPQTITLTNIHPEPITLESYSFDTTLGDAYWEITMQAETLPITLQPGASTEFTIRPFLPVTEPRNRDLLTSPLRFVFDVDAVTVMISFESSLVSSADDHALPQLGPVIAPNPFRTAASIRYSSLGGQTDRIGFYDLRGRLVRRMESGGPSGNRDVIWDGRDDQGRILPSGVYLCRIATGARVLERRLMMVK